MHAHNTLPVNQSIPSSTVTFMAAAWKCAKMLPQTLAIKHWLLNTNNFLLHHRLFDEKHNDCQPHPPYSPDLTPVTVLCSSDWRSNWKAIGLTQFRWFMLKCRQSEHNCQNAFKKWHNYWNQCINVEGAYYFEGDSGHMFTILWPNGRTSPENFGYHIVGYLFLCLKWRWTNVRP